MKKLLEEKFEQERKYYEEHNADNYLMKSCLIKDDELGDLLYIFKRLDKEDRSLSIYGIKGNRLIEHVKCQYSTIHSKGKMFEAITDIRISEYAQNLGFEQELANMVSYDAYIHNTPYAVDLTTTVKVPHPCDKIAEEIPASVKQILINIQQDDLGINIEDEDEKD